MSSNKLNFKLEAGCVTCGHVLQNVLEITDRSTDSFISQETHELVVTAREQLAQRLQNHINIKHKGKGKYYAHEVS